jgi:NADPH:quinone reductase-like Zn-dependent oxidoreductase
MRALCYHGKQDIRCDTVPVPRIEDERDAIVRVTSCVICGSDLHLYDGFMPGMRSGDILGHEFMGEVVEVAPGAKHKLKVAIGSRCLSPSSAANATSAAGAISRSARGSTETRRWPTSVRAHHGRVVWLYAPDWRISRRSGRVCAGVLC